MYSEKYNNQYRKYVNFIKKYRTAINAASGSEVDANANVENKNIATCNGELCKREKIGCNRLLMIDKITEMFGSELAEEYIRQLEFHEIYKHDETSIYPYCVSITMYPYLFGGLKGLGGLSGPPTNLDSFCGSFINMVFAVAAQFAGAVATPEFLLYMDYFIRNDYGDDYPSRWNENVTAPNVKRQRTMKDLVHDKFQQIIYSINQPAAARDFQSVFWNIAYFDEPYFKGMFEDFVFPDDTEPKWETLSFLQKDFMKWFNQERLKEILTFPVETMNLLNDGKQYVDQEWADFAAEMYAEGHSFFTYTSNSVDSLASCCFSGDTMTLSKSSNGVNYMSFKDLYESKSEDTKRNFTVFHNGSWTKGRVIRLPAKKMYRITTSNKKTVFATEDHIFPTMRGDKLVADLTADDYLMFNTRALNAIPERDEHLSYEQGILVGMYLGDGSAEDRGETVTPAIFLSLNQEKYESTLSIVKEALREIDPDAAYHLGKQYNNVYPTSIRSKKVYDFIKKYVSGDYCYEKELNMDCLLQSSAFRRGIVDGMYMTDGGNSNRIYTTSKNLAAQFEAVLTSLGIQSTIDVSDRTDEPVVIRGETFARNYPLYCIRFYADANKRNFGDVYRVRNNSTYFRITDIHPVDRDDEYVYCFEMANPEEPYFTLPNGMITHNCRLRNEMQDNTFSYTLGAGGVATGSKGVMTININRLIQNVAKGKKEISPAEISAAIHEQVQKIHKYLIAYNEVVKDNLKAGLLGVYNSGYISMEKQYLTIGINGFVEGAEFLGIDITPSQEYFDYGKMILEPIYEANKAAKTDEIMFNTEFVPAENLGVKNAKWDREDGYVVPRDCYNSYFYKVEDESCSLVDKFILHGEMMTKYLDGGSALHENLSEHLSYEQYKKVMQTAILTGCPYFTFNVPNTICNECGHISKQKLDKCPNCGSENLDYATRIIGYLKRVSRFSEARQKEAQARYYEKT